MSQHLTQTPASAGHALDVNGRSLNGSHEQIVSILRNRLGQAHGDLLAIPRRRDDGSVDWSTRLAGPVVRADQLPDDERGRLDRWADRLIADIRNLGDKLRHEGPAASMVGHMLEQAIRRPAGDHLYSVDGKPVLVMWGHADSPGSSVGWAAPQPAAASAPSVPLSATDAGVGESVAAVIPKPLIAPAIAARGRSTKHRWILGVLLLVAVIAALLFGMRNCTSMTDRGHGDATNLSEVEAANRQLEVEIARTKAQTPQFMCARPAESAPKADSGPDSSAPGLEPPRQAEATGAAPKPDGYDVLARKFAAAQRDCKALQQIARDPLLRNNDSPAANLKREVSAALSQNCREEMIKEAKNMCPGQRPKELAPQMVLVFDASGSMGFSLDATDEEIQQMAAMDAMQGMMKQFGLGSRGGVDMSRLRREPTRITAARQAAMTVVRGVPSDTSIGLVLVDQCPAARSAGFYSPARRSELISGLQRIEPRQGTPLADGVAKGAQLVDGVSREALMVVISDGRESCSQDPCAVGRALARSKPHLKINVVDILGTGAGNCLAQATGGKVFTARNAGEVAAMTRRAAEDAMGPANCAKP